jgi:hypothetical protein
MASRAKKFNHVHYLKANGRLQSARITNVTSQTVLDLQIGHLVPAGKGAAYPAVAKFTGVGSQSGKFRKTA